ncbi:unnamed protein product [Leptosia nina]|uniref:Histidine-rich glycoprotein-like n=1 Tax=Leptosia nina TaxID=320188 RepID=A0AAV1JSN0_9NEOP
MRAICIFTVALLAGVLADEPWVQEEDLDEHDDYHIDKRDIHIDGPYDEHIRVKRGHGRSKRYKRQVHQYEVYEPFEEGYPAPSYEEMLAASANHYHRYLPPNTRIARHLTGQVNAGPLTFGVSPEPIEVVSPPVNLSPVHSTSPVQFSSPLVTEDKDLTAAAGHVVVKHNPHVISHHQGFGHANHGGHYDSHGGKKVEGSKSDHFVDKGGKGHKTDEHHRKEYEEAAGKKRKHHDLAGHKGHHEEEAFGQRGAHFDEKKGHKKGHKTKGFHNKYHKDEFHKEHKFYDDFHKGGEHHRYGKFNARHATNESGKKKAHHVNAGHDIVEKGKNGYSKKGHVDADHRGYKGQSGHDEHHQHHSQHGKKGGKEGGSQWGYAKKD